MSHFGTKLNPTKCAFDVSIGKFLGFLVIECGIEIDLAQIKEVQELPFPRNKKEVQHLIGKMVAIARFISQYTDHPKPFFNVIKKIKIFEWMVEHKETLLVIKNHLVSPPILKSPQLGNPLFLYLATSKLAISVVLFKLGLNGSQLPVYYVNKVMLLAEQNYSLLEKVALALRVISKKLCPYF